MIIGIFHCVYSWLVSLLVGQIHFWPAQDYGNTCWPFFKSRCVLSNLFIPVIFFFWQVMKLNTGLFIELFHLHLSIFEEYMYYKCFFFFFFLAVVRTSSAWRRPIQEPSLFSVRCARHSRSRVHETSGKIHNTAQCCKFLSPRRLRLPVLGQGYLLQEAGSPGGDLTGPYLSLYLSHRTL